MTLESKKYFYLINNLCDLLSDGDSKKAILKKMVYLKEDFAITEDSFSSKDSVENKAIIKATVKYAEKYYHARLYEIYKDLEQALSPQWSKLTKEDKAELGQLRCDLTNSMHYSGASQEGFKNPYPSYLFFSQTYHQERLSQKSSRKGVSGESIDSLSKQLKDGKISPEYMRVNMYLAPFKNQMHPFVYNNRTWVVFSRANINATRIVPVMPNQDLLNRIAKLDQSKYPNRIENENEEVIKKTDSMLPGPRFL